MIVLGLIAGLPAQAVIRLARARGGGRDQAPAAQEPAGRTAGADEGGADPDGPEA